MASSSVPCKFYARGYCRNGNNCRFFHENQANYRYIRPGVLPENRAQSNSSNTRLQEQERDLKHSLIQDIDCWEYGNQWLFSCFAPIKDVENFPEFNDLSPEELRWNAYQAERQGTIQNYKQEITNLANDIINKRSQLRNPSRSVIEHLVSLSNQPKDGSKPGQQPNVFGNSSSEANSGSTFSFKLPSNRSTTSTASLFGNQTSNPTQTFGNTNVGASFSSGTAMGQPTALFNQSPAFSNFQQNTASNFSFAANNLHMTGSEMSLTPISNHPTFGFGSFHEPSANTSFCGDNVYSKMENLTEEEKQQFYSSTFQLGTIPEKPPPRELV